MGPSHNSIQSTVWLIPILVPLFVLSMGISAFAQKTEASSRPAGGKTPGDEILYDVLLSLSVEGPGSEALTRLRSRPRATLVKGLKEILLQTGHQREAALHVIGELTVHELLPDLKEILNHSESWRLILTISQIANSSELASIRKLFLDRISKESSAVKRVAYVAALGAMKTKFNTAVYESLLKDDSYGVRTEAFNQFLLNRPLYSSYEQIANFKMAFESKPYQLRLSAYLHFGSLPVAERNKLKGALSSGRCEKEAHKQVAEECQKLVRSIASVKAPDKGASK